MGVWCGTVRIYSGKPEGENEEMGGSRFTQEAVYGMLDECEGREQDRGV